MNFEELFSHGPFWAIGALIIGLVWLFFPFLVYSQLASLNKRMAANTKAVSELAEAIKARETS